MTREEFITKHMAVCHRVGDRRYVRTTPHRGRGNSYKKTEHRRRRECAGKLWKKIQERGLDPEKINSSTDLPPLEEK